MSWHSTPRQMKQKRILLTSPNFSAISDNSLTTVNVQARGISLKTVTPSSSKVNANPDNPFYQIYLLDLLTGDTHRVSPGVGKTTCAFFRPGTDEVLYASTHHDAFAKAKQEEELKFRASGKERRYSWDYDEKMDIFSAHRDGSNLKQLTDAPGYDAEAAYSPDGKRIVFCSLRNAYPKSQLSAKDLKQLEVDPAYFGEIYIMNADRIQSNPTHGLSGL